ncbi:hypothetical protein GCM10009535_55050 [Streptomyces thermocarboxydovorans]|uniref:Uncharacterized protein n=1 Tax=Streptomyces thermocarboxydovorans TaxID=59298 RepID=A0ABP3SZC8_9ACTN
MLTEVIYIWMHIREDPVLSVSAGDGVLGHLIDGAPGRIRTCAHGSGEHAQDMCECAADLRRRPLKIA